MNKMQLALKWLEKSEEHLHNCDNENCDWYWSFADFKKKEGYSGVDLRTNHKE